MSARNQVAGTKWQSHAGAYLSQLRIDATQIWSEEIAGQSYHQDYTFFIENTIYKTTRRWTAGENMQIYLIYYATIKSISCEHECIIDYYTIIYYPI